MTELRGASAGWRTAAVVAPAAAAALAVATGWAIEHQPETAGSSTSAALPAQPAQPVAAPFEVDGTDVALQRRARTLQARVEHLTGTLARVRARTEAARTAPLPSIEGGSVPQPPVAHAQAQAPPSHTTTGAS